MRIEDFRLKIENRASGVLNSFSVTGQSRRRGGSYAPHSTLQALGRSGQTSLPLRALNLQSLILNLLLAFLLAGCEMRHQPSVKWQEALPLGRDPHTVPFLWKPEPSYQGLKGSELINPLPDTPETLARGEKLYRTYCDFCHGEAGKGDGPVADQILPRPRDLTSPAIQNQPDGQIFLTITRGYGGMPAFKADLSPDERWAIARYVKRRLY